jgi:hypothetical protein
MIKVNIKKVKDQIFGNERGRFGHLDGAIKVEWVYVGDQMKGLSVDL